MVMNCLPTSVLRKTQPDCRDAAAPLVYAYLKVHKERFKVRDMLFFEQACETPDVGGVRTCACDKMSAGICMIDGRCMQPQPA